MDLFIPFIAGLTIGGVSCFAVQGGLLATLIASQKNLSSLRASLFPIAAFLIAKLLVYILLGALLGVFGKILQLNDTVILVMQTLAGVYMIAVAGNLLNIHPIFRWVVVAPPSNVRKLIRSQSISAQLLAPISLGILTVVIPCGTTIAMELLAITAGNPIRGALIMGAFTFGTIPAFVLLGLAARTLSKMKEGLFAKATAVIILVLGIWSLNGVLVASGSLFNLHTLVQSLPIEINIVGAQQVELSGGVTQLNGVQSVDIQINSQGYSPNQIVVHKDVPVKLNLKTNGVYSCASSFRIPSLGIAKNLAPTAVDSVEFTPKQVGTILFTCSMGMYSGRIQVVET